MKSAIVIPARWNSKRFPGKPLVNLGGKSMIERVYEKCKQTGIDTYVLTDDMRIGRIFGWDVCWIDQEVSYENGTERCAGAIDGETTLSIAGKSTLKSDIDAEGTLTVAS